jgi:signal transduction histidine kinase
MAGPAIAQATDVASTQFQAQVDRARSIMVADPEQGLKLTRELEAQALRMPEGRDRTVAVATARWLRSEAHLRLNDAAAARPLIAQTLNDISGIREPIKLRGDLLLSLGSLQMDDGQAAAALGSYQRAFKVFEDLGDKRGQALGLHYLGSLYSAANDYRRAEQYYSRAAASYDADPSLSLTLHNNRGNVLLAMERYADAEAEYALALKLARQLGNRMLEARILGNLARTQAEARRFVEAEATLRLGFALTESPEAKALRHPLLATAARVAMDRGDVARARGLITEAFDGIDPTTTTASFNYGHIIAYLVYERAGESRLALRHLEAVRRLKDEATKVATTWGAALTATEFDFEGQKTRIAEMKVEEERRAARFQLTLFLSIGAATLLVIAALAWGLINVRRSRNKVRDANIVLGETNVALEKALKAKTEFLATTSHEIRTPLNGILGMTQVMLSDAKIDALTRDRIGIVHGAGVTMRSLVDDILDVAKMETGNLTVEALPMDLCAMLKDVTRLWDEQARAKGLAFNLHLDAAPHWIVSDAGRLRQIMFNLISNAIKFTERGGVSVRVVAEDERLKMSVTDTGIGIPAAKLDDVFESFKQADSGTTRKFGGTGLGLTICRNLAQALGGDVRVESSEGHGSTFIVDLPLVRAEAPEAEAKPTTSGTMLVLDRNPIARSMLKTLFEPHVGTVRFLAAPDEVAAALAEGADWLLIDEMTLKAASDDAFGTLATLAEAATAAGTASTILWLKPDEDVRAALNATGIGRIIEKPVAGAALVEAIISHAEENSGAPGPGPLVSRAA